MCFSAEASFTAAAVISTIGYMAIKSAKKSRFIFLALIPFMFGVQQFSEGLIWLSVNGSMQQPDIFNVAKYSYLAFAFIIWPIWLPLSIFIIEEVPWRKGAIGILLAAGISLSLYFVSYLPNNSIIVEVIHKSLHYKLVDPFTINEWFLIGIYALIIGTPCFFSSTKYLIHFGVLSLFAWLVAEFYYNNNFTSVWCFFCAVVSLFMYIIVKVNVSSKTKSCA